MNMGLKIFNPLPKLFLVGLVCFLLVGCGIYSFTGASLAPDVKTMSIENFTNESGSGPPRLAQNFTEKLRDYFQSNSGVKIVKYEGDLELEGKIIGYEISPIAPQGGGRELASRNRLTIRVQAVFTNHKDSTQSFNQAFQFYGDYDQGVTLSSIENRLIDDEITPQIVFDIFNKAMANW